MRSENAELARHVFRERLLTDHRWVVIDGALELVKLVNLSERNVSEVDATFLNFSLQFLYAFLLKVNGFAW